VIKKAFLPVFHPSVLVVATTLSVTGSGRRADATFCASLSGWKR